MSEAHLCKHSIHKVPRQCLNLFVFEIIIGLSRATDRYFDKLRYFLQDYKHVFVRTLLHRRYLISIVDDVFLCCNFFLLLTKSSGHCYLILLEPFHLTTVINPFTPKSVVHKRNMVAEVLIRYLPFHFQEC